MSFLIVFLSLRLNQNQLQYEETITHLETALMWQNKRTSDRLKRKVEGKHLA